jgi:hypothetical protein
MGCTLKIRSGSEMQREASQIRHERLLRSLHEGSGWVSPDLIAEKCMKVSGTKPTGFSHSANPLLGLPTEPSSNTRLFPVALPSKSFTMSFVLKIPVSLPCVPHCCRWNPHPHQKIRAPNPIVLPVWHNELTLHQDSRWYIPLGIFDTLEHTNDPGGFSPSDEAQAHSLLDEWHNILLSGSGVWFSETSPRIFVFVTTSKRSTTVFLPWKRVEAKATNCWAG